MLSSASFASSVSDENEAPPNPLGSVAFPTSTIAQSVGALWGVRVNEIGLFDDAERDDVDQTILVEAFFEIYVAGDVRNADRVAIRANSINDAPRDVTPVPGSVDSAETQRIGDRNDLGAHAEHVAHDPADAGRCALEGNDLGIVSVPVASREKRTPRLRPCRRNCS